MKKRLGISQKSHFIARDVETTMTYRSKSKMT